MSNNKRFCIFNKEHIIGKKSLVSHYEKSHVKEYTNIMKNGWFCRGDVNLIFINKPLMDKHIDKCEKCKKIFGDDENTLNSISISGFKEIEKKLPKDKKDNFFPKIDLDELKKKSEGVINLDLELINSLIEEEKDLV